MTDRFAHVPMEDDTTVLSQEKIRFGDLEALHQKWSWDGVTAESLIFLSADLAGLETSAVIDRVRTFASLEEETEVTVKCTDCGHTFVNFNVDCD